MFLQTKMARQESELMILYRQTETAYKNLPDPRKKRGRAGSFAIRQAARLPLRPNVPADQDGRQESERILL
jgi:hypothetical protein